MTLKVKIKRLQETRMRNGMSIRALSKAAGVSTATIFKIEKEDNIPMPSTAKKICIALGVEFEEIFEIIQ